MVPAGWYAPPELPRFSGEGAEMSAEDFTMEVKRVLTAYPMADETAAYYIYSHLQGTARREIQLRELEETNTPEKVTNILLGVFGDGRRLTTLLSAFYRRRQQPEESILDYSHELRGMERTISAKDPEALTTDLMRDHFINGLLDLELRRDLRRFVRNKPQTTFIQARDEALRWMKEVEEDLQQESSQQLDHLKGQISMLEQSIRLMQDSVSLIISDQGSGEVKKRGKSQKKKGHKRRGAVKRGHLGASREMGSNRDSSRRKDLKLGTSGRETGELSPKVVRVKKEDPSQGEWVLLPISPEPGPVGACAMKKKKASQDKSTKVGGESHPKTRGHKLSASDSDSKAQTPVCRDKGNSRNQQEGMGLPVTSYGTQSDQNHPPLLVVAG